MQGFQSQQQEVTNMIWNSANVEQLLHNFKKETFFTVSSSDPLRAMLGQLRHAAAAWFLFVLTVVLGI